MTASISVQGSYLVGCHDLVTGDSGDEPGRVVVRSRYCHFCCHRPAGRRWTTRRAARPNRISSSGRGCPDRFKLDRRRWPVFPGRRCMVVNCNPNCNRDASALVTARTVQGMARARSGQALAWPLVSDRSVRRGSGVKRDFACTFTRQFPCARCPAVTVMLEAGGAGTYTQRAIPGADRSQDFFTFARMPTVLPLPPALSDWEVSAAFRGYLPMTCDIMGQLSVTDRGYPRGLTQLGTRWARARNPPMTWAF